MIRLYGRVNSINVQKVLWTLAELGLDHERVDAGMAFGVVNTPEYRALNPNGLVPTLVDGGFTLWESNVIVRYLAERYGRGSLCPADIEARYDVERWMDWHHTALQPGITPVFVNLVRMPPEKRNHDLVAASRKQVEAQFALLDAHLAGRDFVGGARFTMGDIPVGASANRWYKLPIEREPRPNVETWLERLKQRPGFVTHLVDIPLT